MAAAKGEVQSRAARAWKRDGSHLPGGSGSFVSSARDAEPMTPKPYQCRFENIATVVANLGAPVDAGDVAEAFPDLIELDDHNTQVMLVAAENLDLAVLRMASIAAEPELEGPSRANDSAAEGLGCCGSGAADDIAGA